MDWCKTLILINFGVSFIICSNFPFRKFFYISSQKNWTDAQLYCRENHTDLVTFESLDDVTELYALATFGAVWIGLHDDPAAWKGTMGNDSNSWRWSTTGQTATSQYHNWMNGEPNFVNAVEKCVVMESNGNWKDRKCGLLRSFLCYADLGQNQKSYEYISVTEKWSDAQTYCRQHYTDLAVITNSEENTLAQSVIPASTESWIGLYRVPWIWSDNNPSTFRKWAAGQPDHDSQNQNCVYMNTRKMFDRQCSEPKPFICTEVTKSRSRMKMMMKTTSNLTDPPLNEQILQKISAAFKSQGWTDFKLPWTTQPRKPSETYQVNACVFNGSI